VCTRRNGNWRRTSLSRGTPTRPRDSTRTSGAAPCRCSRHQVDNRPAAGLLALAYRIRPSSAAEVARAYHATAHRLALPGDGRIIALLLLAKDDLVVRVVQHEAVPSDYVMRYLATQSPAAATEAWLAPLLTAPRPPETDLAEHVARHRMRCVSHLSAAVTG